VIREMVPRYGKRSKRAPRDACTPECECVTLYVCLHRAHMHTCMHSLEACAFKTSVRLLRFGTYSTSESAVYKSGLHLYNGM
jgi:hypothetical protein